MTNIFLSYSRRNIDFTRKLFDRLNLAGRDSWIDWIGIWEASENWWNDIQSGIDNADTFVFIITPESLSSVVCNMELNYALEIHKHVVAVVRQYEEGDETAAISSLATYKPDNAMLDRLEGQDVIVLARDNWKQLSHINWTFFREQDDFDESFRTFLEAIDTDLEHVRTHKRLFVRAKEWKDNKRSTDLLLFGEQIPSAERWLSEALDKDKKPPPTALHSEFIRESRKLEDERIRLKNEQEERTQKLQSETQLAQEENTRLAKRSQQFRIAAGVLGVMIVLAIVAVVFIGQQALAAQEQVAQANETLTQVPPTLTAVYTQVALAEEAAAIAQEEADAAIAVAATAQAQADTAQEAAAEAQAQANAALAEVAVAKEQLLAITPTFAAIETQVQSSLNFSDALRISSAAQEVYSSGNAALALALALQASLIENPPAQVQRILDEVGNNPATPRRTVQTNIFLDVIASSPDGQEFATNAGSEIVLRDTKTATTQIVLRGHSGRISAIIYSPDGRYLISGDSSGNIFVWDTSNYNAVQALVGHSTGIQSLSIDSRGEDLLSTDYDGNMIIWNLRDGTGSTLPIHSAGDAVFVPNTSQIIFHAEDKLTLWNLDTQQAVRNYDASFFYGRKVAIDPTGRIVAAVVGGQQVNFWDIQTGATLLELHGHNTVLTSLAFSRSGTMFVSGSEDQQVILWDVGTAQIIRRYNGHPEWVQSVSISGDEKHIISGDQGGSLFVWDINEEGGGQTIDYSDGHASVVDFTADGSQFVSQTFSSDFYLKDTKTGQIIRTFSGHNQDLGRVDISENGKYIISVDDSSKIFVWDAQTGQRIQSLIDPDTNAQDALEISDDGLWALSTAGFGDIGLVWDIEGGEVVQTLEGHSNTILDFAFLPDGKRALSASFDHTMILWDLTTGNIIHHFTDHTQSANRVDVTSDGRYAITASEDRTLILWDLETGANIRSFDGHTNWVWVVSISPDDQHAVSLDADGNVKLWDINTGQALQTYTTGTSDDRWGTGISFNGNGSEFYVRSADDGMIKGWSLGNLESIQRWVAENRALVPLTCSVRENYDLRAKCDSTGNVNETLPDFLQDAIDRAQNQATASIINWNSQSEIVASASSTVSTAQSGQNTTSNTNTSSTTTATVDSDLSLYENPYFGYSLAYPADWGENVCLYADGTDSWTIYSPYYPDNPDSYYQLSVRTLAYYSREDMLDLSSTWYNFIEQNQSTRDINGLTYDVVSGINDYQEYIYQLSTSLDDIGYFISLSGNDDIQAYVDVFESALMLNTNPITLQSRENPFYDSNSTNIDLRLYENTAYDFSLAYPADWYAELCLSDYGNNWYAYSSDGQYSLQIDTEESLSQSDLSEWDDSYLSGWVTEITKSSQDINGRTFNLSAGLTNDERKETVYRLSISVNDIGYFITLRGEPNNIDSYYDILVNEFYIDN